MHSYALDELPRDVTVGAGLEKQFAFSHPAAGGQSTILSCKTAHSGIALAHCCHTMYTADVEECCAYFDLPASILSVQKVLELCAAAACITHSIDATRGTRPCHASLHQLLLDSYARPTKRQV